MSHVSCPNMDPIEFCHFGSLTYKESELLLKNTADIKLLISGGNCTKIWSHCLLFQSIKHWDKNSLYLNEALKSNISICHSNTYPASTILSPIPLIENSHKPLIHQSQNSSLNLSREKVLIDVIENRNGEVSHESLVQNGSSTNIIDRITFLNIADNSTNSQTDSDRRNEIQNRSPEATTNDAFNNNPTTRKANNNDVVSNSTDLLNNRVKEQPIKSESSTNPKPIETIWSRPWASLFKDNNNIITTTQTPIQNHIFNHTEGANNISHSKTVKSNFDMTDTLEKGRKLNSYLNSKQSESQKHLQPRGLANRGNLCYIHASLQSLLATKEFVQLISGFEPFPFLSTKPSPTPVFESIILFYHNFIATQKISNVGKRSKRKSQNLLSSQTNNTMNSPFEPENIYSMLKKLQPPNLSLRRQEDSEEFLGFILQKLHEEMSYVIQIYSNVNSKSDTNLPNSHNTKLTPEMNNEWLEVGKKNKTATTRSVFINSSPISQIFGGEIRSTIQLSKSNSSVTYQPFFSLQLDIQNNQIKDIRDALKTMFVTEQVEGFKGSKEQVEMTISKRQSISILPLILILHIKRFAFHLNSCYKISTPIDYPITLTMPKNVLSSEFHGKEKSDVLYKLFAVIYHLGDNASGGHYTCAYDAGCNGNWILADDSKISNISEQMVLEHILKRTVYLLFYRKLN